MHILFWCELFKNIADNCNAGFLKFQKSGKQVIHIINNYSSNKYYDTNLSIRCSYMLVNLYLVKNMFYLIAYTCCNYVSVSL